jgi:hypothetical protein
MQPNNFKGVYLLAVLAGTHAIADAQRMAPHSYLRKPIQSRTQLVKQVKEDPIVAHRYAKHFGVSDKTVVRYFSSMRTSTIQKTGKYKVYNYRENGSIEWKMLTLKKGEKIFLDGSGRIAMRMSCGNPMLGAREAALLDEETPVAKIPDQTPQTFVNPEPEPEPIPVPPPVVVEGPPNIVAVVPIAPETIIPPVVVPPVAAQPIVPAGGGGGIGFLPILLGAGALAAIGGGGGGGGGTPVAPPPPPVPEPATMLVLAGGTLAMCAKRRRAKK